MSHTPYVTNYAEKEERREAYLAFIRRVCAKYDDRPCPSFTPVDKRTEAVMNQP